MPITALLLQVASDARLGQGEDLSVPWARIVLALLFCLALAVAAILIVRQKQGLGTSFDSLRKLMEGHAGQAGAATGLAIEQRLRITPASQVLVLRCEQRRYLIHVSAQGAQVLDRLDDTAPPSGAEA